MIDLGKAKTMFNSFLKIARTSSLALCMQLAAFHDVVFHRAVVEGTLHECMNASACVNAISFSFLAVLRFSGLCQLMLSAWSVLDSHPF